MGVPVVLATVAACGSIVTSIKSSWELRRMVKKKQEQKDADEEAPYVFRKLRKAYYNGLMSTREYENWYEKFLLAKVEKDLHALRRIRAHIRILENGAPMSGSQRSRSSSQSHSHSHDPRSRRHSISYGNGGSGLTYRDYERLDYYPEDRNKEMRITRRATDDYMGGPLARHGTTGYVSRSSSVSVDSKPSRSSSAAPRRDRDDRGRSRGRYEPESESESDYYYEKKEYRGRSQSRHR